MTRLTAPDIASVADGLRIYDASLKRKTGLDLMGVACHGTGIGRDATAAWLAGKRVAVVPLSCGGGVIRGFADSVARIAAHMGCAAWAAAAADADGFAEAVTGRAAVVMTADDHRFIAADLSAGTVVDNGEATGRGFAAGLDRMAGGVKGRTVAVIGCGPVGRGAAAFLVNLGARVRLFDTDARRGGQAAVALAGSGPGTAVALPSLNAALDGCRLFVEASPAVCTLPASRIFPDTFIAAPGLPLGAEIGGVPGAEDRLLHDPLQIGVATMLAMTAAAGLRPSAEPPKGKDPGA